MSEEACTVVLYCCTPRLGSVGKLGKAGCPCETEQSQYHHQKVISFTTKILHQNKEACLDSRVFADFHDTVRTMTWLSMIGTVFYYCSLPVTTLLRWLLIPLAPLQHLGRYIIAGCLWPFTLLARFEVSKTGSSPS